MKKNNNPIALGLISLGVIGIVAGAFYLNERAGIELSYLSSSASSADRITIVESAAFTSRMTEVSQASIFGVDFTDESVSTTDEFIYSLGGVRVFAQQDGSGEFVPVEIQYVSPTQLNVALPLSNEFPPVKSRAIIKVVTKNGRTILSDPVTLDYNKPNLYSADATGKGLVSALLMKYDPVSKTHSYSNVTKNNPTTGKPEIIPIVVDDKTSIDPKNPDFVILYGTGINGFNQSEYSSFVNQVQIGNRTIPCVNYQPSILESSKCFYGNSNLPRIRGLSAVFVKLDKSFGDLGNTSVSFGQPSNMSNSLNLTFASALTQSDTVTMFGKTFQARNVSLQSGLPLTSIPKLTQSSLWVGSYSVAQAAKGSTSIKLTWPASLTGNIKVVRKTGSVSSYTLPDPTKDILPANYSGNTYTYVFSTIQNGQEKIITTLSLRPCSSSGTPTPCPSTATVVVSN